MKVEYNGDIINTIKENIFYDDEYVMSSDIIDDLNRAGQNYVVSELEKKKSKEDKNIILRSFDIYPEENISINKTSNLIEYVFNRRKDFRVEDEIRVYTDIENSNIKIIVSSSSKINILEQRWQGFNYVISYSIKFNRNTFNEDLLESIAVSIGHKIYKYTVLLRCEENVSFQGKYSNVDEFYNFYKQNYRQALRDFCKKEFAEWLRVNQFKKALSTYSCLNNENNKIALQNFLQYMGYDVKPKIFIEIEDEKIIIKNRGKGFLYGDIEGRNGVILKKTQWNEMNNNVSFKRIATGEIIINSNGGRVRKVIYHEKEVIEQKVLKLKGINKLYGMRIKLRNNNRENYLRGKKDKPKVTQSNKYLKVIFNAKKNRFILKNKVSLFKLIKIKFKKKQNVITNVNIQWDCKIYKYQVKIILW